MRKVFKKFACIVVVLLMVVSSTPFSPLAEGVGNDTMQGNTIIQVVEKSEKEGIFENGDGSKEYPYEINKKEQFYAIEDNPNASYVLSSSLDLGEYEGLSSFSGNFDGNGYTITYTQKYTKSEGGLFGTVEENAKISNLNINWTPYLTAEGYCQGGVASTNRGTIFNCEVSGNYGNGINGSFDKLGWTGGIVANNTYTGIVSYCKSNVNVSIQALGIYHCGFGGIAWMNSGKIEYCVNTGNIDIYHGAYIPGSGVGVAFLFAGGIVGNNSGGNVNNCANEATYLKVDNYDIDGTNPYYRVGFIVGGEYYTISRDDIGNITNCIVNKGAYVDLYNKSYASYYQYYAKDSEYDLRDVYEIEKWWDDITKDLVKFNPGLEHNPGLEQLEIFSIENSKTIPLGNGSYVSGIFGYVDIEQISNLNFVWTSSNESIVRIEGREISSSSSMNGISIFRLKLNALKEGKAVIIGQAGGRKVLCEITVSKDAIESSNKFSINGPDYCNIGKEIYVSGNFETINPESIEDELKGIIWTSNTPDIAEVNNNTLTYILGEDKTNAYYQVRLNCYKPGKVTITGITKDGIVATKEISVEPEMILDIPQNIYNESNVTCSVYLNEADLFYLKEFMDGLTYKYESDFASISVISSSYEIAKDGLSAVYTLKVSPNMGENGNVKFIFTSSGGQIKEVTASVLLNFQKRDVWNFSNSATCYIDEAGGYYITNKDYQTLIKNLNETAKDSISIINVDKMYLPTYNIDGSRTGKCLRWIGSCYGMSAWVCLVKKGILSATNLGGDSLNSININSNVRSAINFYQNQQFLPSVAVRFEEFMKKTQDEQLQILEDLAIKRETMFIFFQWYPEFNDDDTCNEKKGNGHVIVGYDIEYGSWKKEVNGKTDIYTKRIVTYDCSIPNGGEDYYIYYNEDGIWCIPGWKIISTSSQTRDTKYNNGQFVVVTTDDEIINAVDYNSGIPSNETDLDKSVLFAEASSNYSLSWENGSCNISGFTVSDSVGNIPIYVYIPATNKEENNSKTKIAILPSIEKNYTVASKENELSFSLVNDKYFSAVSANSSGSIVFKNSGGVSLKTDENANYHLKLTANEGYNCLPWYTVEVSGSETTEISAEMTDKGIIINGDNLNDIVITGTKDNENKDITVSTEESSIMIAEKDGELAAFEDRNGDGTFETNIVSSGNSKIDQTIVASISSSNIEVGNTAIITATAKTDKMSYISSDTNVAVVDEFGTVTAIAPGKTTITITADGNEQYNSATTTIEVIVIRKEIPITSIVLNKTKMELEEGTSEKLSVSYTPSDTTDEKKVTWKSDNEGVAKVASDGTVTAVKEGTATITATTANGKTASCVITVMPEPEKPIQIYYRTHVQNLGWQSYVTDGVMSGTTGKSLRLEGIEIYLENNKIGGSIEYRTHVQNLGWQPYVTDGAMSGTKGKSLRLEAIQIRLTGELAQKYDVYYRTHIQDLGWLGWAVNDGKSGSAGLSKRLEGIQIRLVEKGESAPGTTENAYMTNEKTYHPSVSYSTHVQNLGWQSEVKDGVMSGTKGKSLRLEGIKIRVNGDGLSGGIEYSTHVQNLGWQPYVCNGEMAGTKGKSLRLEGIKIRLTGELAKKYSVEYRTHVQNLGWQDWVRDDSLSGTKGKGLRLEGIEIRIVKK